MPKDAIIDSREGTVAYSFEPELTEIIIAAGAAAGYEFTAQDAGNAGYPASFELRTQDGTVAYQVFKPNWVDIFQQIWQDYRCDQLYASNL